MVGVRRIDADTPEFEASLELRYRVMYEPFGLGRELASGLETPGRFHVGAFDGDDLVGYARLAPNGGDLKLYQVVVEPERQGLGIGRALVDALVDEARARGHGRVTLDARLPAVSFYERLGFTPAGPEFLMPRTRMPHVPMILEGL